MPRLTGDQRRAVIDAALGKLHGESLSTEIGGTAIRTILRDVIQDTLDDDEGQPGDGYDIGAVINLLREMENAAANEIVHQTGVSPAAAALAARGSEGSDTLQ